MNHADKNCLIKSDGQIQDQRPRDCLSCELSFNEDDFQRIFDDEHEKPVSIYRDWDESGHGRMDFL